MPEPEFSKLHCFFSRIFLFQRKEKGFLNPGRELSVELGSSSAGSQDIHATLLGHLALMKDIT